jgi:branched-chain amino acid transport system substrate-binding protein
MMEMMKKSFVMLAIVIILSLLLWSVIENLIQDEKQPIRVAFIGPMSGEGKAAGQLMKQAIELYFEEVNKEKINGKSIELEPFNDQNSCTGDKAKAKEEALNIVKDNRFVAVIGHWYSGCSITGGKIYKKYGIPAITPGSVKKEVTENNHWYFRNIYNASASGQFLAYYVNKVFGLNQVSIIHDNTGYGSYLADEFKKSAIQLGMEIKNQWNFHNNENMKSDIENIVNQLKENAQEAGAILLATQATEGIPLVKLIKDKNIQNHIISGSGFSEQAFKNGFDKFSKEKANPGYYTNDIYVATPLIFDTANEKAQEFKNTYLEKYHEEADWSAAYAYDTAMVLVKAIKQAKITGTQESIVTDRQKIRKTLAGFTNIHEAVEGATGFNYFDDQRDAQKPVAIGVYKNKELVSALTQFQVMRNRHEVPDWDKAQEKGRVLEIGDNRYYKTNVVYTGIEIHEISGIDKDLTFLLDFHLWFRSRDGFDPQNIEFINAVEVVPEKDVVVPPSIEEQLKKPIKEKTKDQKDQMAYRLYRIKSRFKADFSNYYVSKQHTLGIRFHHKTLTRNNLIYVTDVLGMGDTQNVKKNMQEKQVLNPTTGWSIAEAKFFQDVAKKYSLGDPQYLNVQDGKVEYSQFNAIIQIKKNEMTLRGKMESGTAYYMMVLSGICILLLSIFSKKFKDMSKLVWFFQSILTVMLLLSGEIWLLDQLSQIIKDNELILNLTFDPTFVINIFDILWWLIPAFLLNLASEKFIWTPLEEKSGRLIPNIVRLFLSFLIYFMAIVGIVAFVYDQQLTSILATSGVIAMIIGLAIQINISNIFSGIAINIESPFKLGDWVQIGDFEEGKVVDITWRSTRILTRKECILSIPNSMASESPILNFCFPKEVFWLWPTVYVHPKHSPERVKKILLDALLSANHKVLKEPAPIAFFTGINEWAASYWIAFCADDYANKYFILEEVWTRVWFHLNRAGITPAVQRQEIHLFKGIKERGGEEATKPITLLQEIEIFKPFSEEAKQHLSQNIRRHQFGQGDVIVQQCDAGDSLFIIVEGVVAVKVETNDGKIKEVARLGAGDFFGEMALLTGEDRTATVVAIVDTYLFELTKADIRPLIIKQPEVLERVSKVLASRYKDTELVKTTVEDDVKTKKKAISDVILERIHWFFRN